MNKYYIVVISMLLILYGYFLYLSLNGWGYAGYSQRSYYRPSWMYYTHSNFYPNRDMRHGSVGGRGIRGGGPGAGK